MTWFNEALMHEVQIPIYGPVETLTGTIDVEGVVIDLSGQTHRPITSYQPGYHLNVAPEVITAHPALEAFIITPSSPAMVFAGAETVFLSAPSQDDIAAAFAS